MRRQGKCGRRDRAKTARVSTAVAVYPVSAHDVVAGHALSRESQGDLLDQNGEIDTYSADMGTVSLKCFGGAPTACLILLRRDWSGLLHPRVIS